MVGTKRRRGIKHFLVPHKGNRYKPGLFARETVTALALVLLALEGAYLVQVNFVLKKTGFLAAVLPAALTALTDADRTSAGLPALTEDPLLEQAAQDKANDMAQNGYFAHVSPSGKTPWYWLQLVGYPYTYAGENLAVDFTDSTDVEKAWMNSPEHRANILKSEYTHIGIAVAQGMYQGQEVTFVVELFAARSDDTASATAAAPANAVHTVAAVAATPATQTVEIVAKPQVLGAQEQVVPQQVPGAVAVASTSPSSIVWYLMLGFTAFIAVIFGLTLIVHARKKLFYAEVAVGGLALLGIVALVLYYNNETAAAVRVASGSQSASVAHAL